MIEQLTNEQLDEIEARLNRYAEYGGRVPLTEYIDYDELVALVAELRRAREYVATADQTIFEAGVKLGEASNELARLREALTEIHRDAKQNDMLYLTSVAADALSLQASDGAER